MADPRSNPDWRERLFARRLLGVRTSIAPTERVLDLLLPGLRERPPFTVVQVVGTNGKGSTSAMIEHGLRKLGHGPVGLFISPHLEQVGERIQIDGRPVDDALVEQGIVELAAVEQRAGEQLSFFEVLTVLALRCFVEAGCRMVVLEAGLGGRLDATSVLRPQVVAITRIALDHQTLLGDTIAAIAGEKAAVMHAGAPAFSLAQVPEARAVIEAVAAQRGVRLSFVEPLERSPTSLPGEHQRHNAALALAVLRELDARADASLFDDVRWPGRLERLPNDGASDGASDGLGQLWIDVAHNVDGIEALCRAIEQLKINPGAIVFGTLADKPAIEMAARLRPHGPLWLTPPSSANAFELARVAAPGERMFLGPDDPALFEAIRALLRAGQNVLVCGSNYLVGGVRARWRDASAVVHGVERSDPMPRPRA